MDEVVELRAALDRLHCAVEDVALRGIRSVGPTELARLKALSEEFQTAGAGHLGAKLDAIVQSISNNSGESVGALLRAMTAARLFDRMLTLEVCANGFAELLADRNEAFIDEGN